MDTHTLETLLASPARTRTPVLLFHPPGQPFTSPPLGLLYLAATLRKCGYAVRVLDASIAGISLAEAVARIRSFPVPPAVIGLSCVTAFWEHVRVLVPLLRKTCPAARIVLGGPHVTALPEEALEQSGADYLVLGEGEVTFTVLCRSLLGEDPAGPEEIRGLCFRGPDGRPTRTPAREYIPDLDRVPPPALDLVPYRKYRNYGRLVRTPPVGVVMGSRGCPYSCLFCFNSIFGKRYRVLSAERIAGEIRDQIARYRIREVSFLENTFTTSRERVEEVCRVLEGIRPGVCWTCNLTVKVVNRHPGLLPAMKRAGCWLVSIGVESGSARIHEILKKDLTPQEIHEGFDRCRRAGLTTLAYVQVGNYDDDRESVRQTIDFLGRLPATYAAIYVTIPFPGSELWDRVRNTPLMGREDFSSISQMKTGAGKSLSPLRTPHLSQQELYRWSRWATARFYLRPLQVMRILRSLDTFSQWVALGRAFASHFLRMIPRAMDTAERPPGPDPVLPPGEKG